MTGFLLITAFTVSVDSFACGFSLAFNEKGKGRLIVALVIALTVFVMCSAANCAATAVSDVLNDKTVSLGGIILVGIGLYNLLKSSKESEGIAALSPKKEGDGLVKQSLLSGVAVGLDGAAANLSLAVSGINEFYVPVIIAAMHAVMIMLGVSLAGSPFIKKFGRLKFLPPLVLILLGLYKLLPLLI